MRCKGVYSITDRLRYWGPFRIVIPETLHLISFTGVILLLPEEAENATSVWYERYIFCLIFVCYKSMILGVFSVFDTIREKSKIVFLFFKACISDDFVFFQAKG